MIDEMIVHSQHPFCELATLGFIYLYLLLPVSEPEVRYGGGGWGGGGRIKHLELLGTNLTCSTKVPPNLVRVIVAQTWMGQ